MTFSAHVEDEHEDAWTYTAEIVKPEDVAELKRVLSLPCRGDVDFDFRVDD